MFNLHVIQAKNGDCFILEFGSEEEPKYILIDGGPYKIYKKYLKNFLDKIKLKTDHLELIILSHIDSDHIAGLIDLLKDRYFDIKNKTNEILESNDIWFNDFRNAYDINEDAEIKINVCLDNIDRILGKKIKATRSFRQAAELNYFIDKLSISVNRHFDSKAVTCENHSKPIIFDNIQINIIGPNLESLRNLGIKWNEWVREDCPKLKRDDEKDLFIKADKSKPNLSSIMILVEANNKRILLTGDGFMEHIINGLICNNFLKEEEQFFVDVLKIPHHGSDKNINPTFFETIIADKYVISGDGSNDNPKLITLEWIVEAAKKQGRRIEIFATNRTDNIEELLKRKKPSDYNYKLIIMDEKDSSIIINLSDFEFSIRK